MLFDKLSIFDRQTNHLVRYGLRSTVLVGTLVLSACTFQPLYAPNSAPSGVNGNIAGGAVFSRIRVNEVETRVGQQVRNHLQFLLHGRNKSLSPRIEINLLVRSYEKRTFSQASTRDTTAGFVTVDVSYTLVDINKQSQISKGSRTATSYFDRTSQVYANQRAVRDAENRAGREAAEKIRLAIASDLSK